MAAKGDHIDFMFLDPSPLPTRPLDPLLDQDGSRNRNVVGSFKRSSGGSKAGCPRHASQNFLNFMQFWENPAYLCNTSNSDKKYGSTREDAWVTVQGSKSKFNPSGG